jgi:signal transduction histidine kinase
MALALIALVAMSVGVYISQQRALREGLEETLLLAAGDLAASPPQGSITPIVDDDLLAQVIRGGEVIAWTDNVAGMAPIEGTAVRVIEPWGDGAAYLVVTEVTGDLVVHVGSPTDDIEHAARGLLIGLATFVPIVLAAMGLMVWWLVGRTLAPVEQIRAEAAQINAESLDRRVPVPDGDDEIAALAETMNAMLDRLEEGSNRQRRLIADVSHELRTPLARMRADLEVDIAHPETANTWATIEGALADTKELQDLVADILVLARVGEGKTEDLDLRLLARREIEATGSSAELTGDEAVWTSGNANDLGRAIRNLLENAEIHGRPPVRVEVRRHDREVVMTVADHGPGVPQESREEVFERFVTLDSARGGPGVGLGLAIAREVATRYGGTLDLDPAYRDGAKFRLTLPAI